LLVGDVIFYWHDLFVCGNPMGRRTATVRDIDPNRDPMLRLDTMDYLRRDHCVQRIKVLQPDGTMVENIDAKWREIQEFRLHKSAPAPYRMSVDGARVGRLLGRLSDQYLASAEELGMPQDLLISNASNKENIPQKDPTRESNDEEATVESMEINFCKLVAEGGQKRAELENLGRAGQEKQAKQVNKNRGNGGNCEEVIGKWTICTLEMPRDKNNLTPNNLPVLICGVSYFKKTGLFRYK